MCLILLTMTHTDVEFNLVKFSEEWHSQEVSNRTQVLI